MADIEPIEGPWTDDDRNECLGIWADEGGVLLEMQRTAAGRVTFYILNPHDSSRGCTIAPFRWERIRKFLEQPDA